MTTKNKKETVSVLEEEGAFIAMGNLEREAYFKRSIVKLRLLTQAMPEDYHPFMNELAQTLMEAKVELEETGVKEEQEKKTKTKKGKGGK